MIEFWADNCSGQNKNWVLYTALVYVVNLEWGPEAVSIKYLEKGHTFMGADGVHGAIGKAMGRRPEIVSFDDFVKICTKASKNIRPVIMGAQDFYEVRSEVKRRGPRNATYQHSKV